MSTLTKEQATVEKLLPEIRATHKAFLKSGQETVELARQIGDMLWKLKECVKQGEWTPIVEDRCEFDIRSAQTYMKVSGGWGIIEQQKVPPTSIDGCVKLIGQKGGKTKALRKSTNSGGSSKPPAAASGKDDRTDSTGTTPQEPSTGQSGSDTDNPVDLGICPNCGGKKWTEDEFGASCAKCNHPHGEPVGDQDEQRVGVERSKAIKTVEALMRSVCDLGRLLPKPKEQAHLIAQCKLILTELRAWK